MDKARLVAIYIRVSSARQAEEGYSLEAQEKVLRDEILRQGKIVFKVYRDEGISGARYDRPGLQELLKDAKKGLFGSVGIWMISRISRSLPNLLKIIEELKKADVKLFSLTERFDMDTPIGNFTAQIFGSVAQMQRDNIRHNVLLGSKERAKGGKTVGCSVLGYRLVPDTDDPKGTTKLEIVPEEAELVRKIFDLYCQGNGLKVIAQTVNAQGYCGKKGKTFSILTIRGILTNQLYIGKVKYCNEYFDGIHEPIISREQWETVQRLLSSKVSYEKSIDYQYLLSGLIKCRGCGSGMIPAHVTHRNKNGTTKVYYYYSCGLYLNKGTGSCKPNVVRAKEADAVVMDFVCNHLSTKEWQNRILKRVKAKIAVNEKLLEDINKLQNRLSRLKAKRDALLFDYEEGRITKMQLVESDKSLQAEIEMVGVELLRKQTIDDKPHIDEELIKEAFMLLPTLIQRASYEEKLGLLRGVVKAVYVDEERKVEAMEIYIPKSKNTGIETMRINIKEREG